MTKITHAEALIALGRFLALLVLLGLAMHGLTGCTVTPAKLMGPTYERSWELQERQAAPQTCPAPWVNEHKFYQLNIGA